MIEARDYFILMAVIRLMVCAIESRLLVVALKADGYKCTVMTMICNIQCFVRAGDRQ
jgi:hypothetical protein